MDNVFHNYPRGVLIFCLIMSGSLMGSELGISGIFNLENQIKDITQTSITVCHNNESGGSAVFGLSQSDLGEMHMVGYDHQYSIANLNLKGEYVQHSFNCSIQEEMNKGFYVQGPYNTIEFFAVGRYGAFQPDGDDWANRYSIGVDYGSSDGVEIRYESSINQNSNGNSSICKLPPVSRNRPK